MGFVGWRTYVDLYCKSTKSTKGPAVGKAGNFLDWIAGGLEMNEMKLVEKARLVQTRKTSTLSQSGMQAYQTVWT